MYGNMYNIIEEKTQQSRFNTGSLGLVHWDDLKGRYGEGGGRGVQDGDSGVGGGSSGWGTRVRPWRIHVDVEQNQYNIVK